MAKILSFVGKSNSGKTTIIENVVPILKDQGLNVLVIKHAKRFEIDREGKDSYRIFRSGADVVITSKDKTAFISRFSDDLDFICEVFGRFYDLVITEGFSRACKDRVVVLNCPEELSNYNCGRIIAVVADFNVDGYISIRKNDYEGIAKVIIDWFYS